MSDRLTVLVLAPFDGSDASAVRDFLFSFHAFSRHDYRYVFDLRVLDSRLDISTFDVIVLFWTLDLLGPELSEALQIRIAASPALKIVFRQDDYRDVRAANAVMRRLGTHVVFTCVRGADHEAFYPRERIPSLEACYTALPGYVPRGLERTIARPARARPIDIGYRSRAMPYYLGDIGQEKRVIAERFHAIAERHGLRADISVREEDRLYGRRWSSFLGSCRCVLGTASGASVVDFTGDIRRNCERYVALNPRATYEDVKARFFADVDGRLSIDTVSPRIFEAAAVGCTMVNHEGHYGGILQPDHHYIRVKRDYSNVGEVVDRIKDAAFCRRLADNAHADLIASGRYAYATFVREFDDALARHARAPLRARSRAAVGFYARNYIRHGQAVVPYRDRFLLVPSSHFLFEMLRRSLARLPRFRHGPILGRLIQNPMNFAIKAATTWWIVLTTPPMRALFRAYLCARRSGSPVSLFALLDDVRKLEIVRRARLGTLRTRQAFDVVGHFEAASKVLTLTSALPSAGRACLPPAEPTDIAESVATVVWDHCALGQQVMYALGRRRWLTASVGPGGVHRFDAIAELLRGQPAIVRPALRLLLRRPADVHRADRALPIEGVAR
jgi:hypothetical protein